VESLIQAQFLGHGEYDVVVPGRDGADDWKPRYIDLYSPESGTVRLSLAKDTPPVHGYDMGDWVNLRCTVRNQAKQSGDRTFNVVRMQVTSCESDQQRLALIDAYSPGAAEASEVA